MLLQNVRDFSEALELCQNDKLGANFLDVPCLLQCAETIIKPIIF